MNLKTFDPEVIKGYGESKAINVAPLEERMTVPVTDFWTGEAIEGEVIKLESSVFGRPLRIDILQRVVRYQLALKRGKRTAKVKGIGDVSFI